MKKLYMAIAYCAFPVAFNLIFFLVCGTRHVASVWLSYAWINAAYAAFVCCGVIPSAGKYAYIFKRVTGLTSFIYFAVELIIGCIMIALHLPSVTAPIVAQVIPLAAFVIIAGVTAATNTHTAAEGERRAVESANVLRAANRVLKLIDFTDDEATKKGLQYIYDLIHASPTKSYPAVRAIEQEIDESLSRLEEAVLSGESGILYTIKDVERLVRQRNRSLRELHE